MLSLGRLSAEPWKAVLSLGKLKPKKKLDKAVETKGLMMARFSFTLQGFFFKKCKSNRNLMATRAFFRLQKKELLSQHHWMCPLQLMFFSKNIIQDLENQHD